MVIDENGDNLGTMPTAAALELAQEQGLDLVEINPTNRPPVCKIIDFGRYKYDLSKQEKEKKSKQKESDLKEIRLTFKIGDHDLEYKAKQVQEFLEKGHQVRVSMRLRGRENILGTTALSVFDRFKEKTGLAYEGNPLRAGNTITAMIAQPKR